MRITRRALLLVVLALSLGLITASLASAGTGAGAFGYGFSATTYDWVDISQTGTDLDLGDDDSDSVAIGFSYDHYGATYTSVHVGSNGYLTFNPLGETDLSEGCPPTSTDAENLLSPMFDDLNPAAAGGAVLFESFGAGSCPYGSYAGACAVAAWEGVEQWNAGDVNTFEVILFDDHTAVFQYEELGVATSSDGYVGATNVGNTATSNYNGTGCTSNVGANDAILVEPLGPPVIVVSPSTLAAQHAAPGTTNDVLTIMNNGEATLDFDIVEQVPRNLPVQGDGIATKHATNVPEGYAPVAPWNRGGNAVADPSFEDGSPNAFWTEASTTFGSPLCTLAGCGNGSGTGANSGLWWVWFGGIGAYEEASVSQIVTIPTASTQLTFELEMFVCDSASDYLEITVDGTQIWSIDGSSALCEQFGYTTQTVDVTAYADGGAHLLAFHSEIFAVNFGTTNFFVDDVAILGPPDPGTCADGDWINWFDLDQWDGSLAGGASVDLNATFDSTGLADGLHLGTLCIASNDLANPLIEYPVRLSLNGPTDVSLTAFDGNASNSGLIVALGGLALVAFGIFVGMRRRQNV